MSGITFIIYVYLIQSTFKMTASQIESSITNTPENDYSITETDYVPELFSATETKLADVKESFDVDDSSPEWSAKHADDVESITTMDEPKSMPHTDAPTVDMKTTPVIENKGAHATLESSLEINPTNDFTETLTTEMLTDVDHEKTVHKEPFSMFLRKLLILLCVKRSTDLRNLVAPFVNFVEGLLIAGKLKVLGPETVTYIHDVIRSINHSSIYVLRNELGELQLILTNRNGKNDLLTYMDDLYEVTEEEAMQQVLNAVTMFPNGHRSARSITRWFVNKVFLNPMNRIAQTKRGEHLLSTIKNIVRSKTSFNITKLINRNKNVITKTKVTAKDTESTNDNKNNNERNDEKRIINNVHNIEDMLRDRRINDNEEDESTSDGESHISEKNYSYKLTTSLEYRKQARKVEPLRYHEDSYETYLDTSERDTVKYENKMSSKAIGKQKADFNNLTNRHRFIVTKNIANDFKDEHDKVEKTKHVHDFYGEVDVVSYNAKIRNVKDDFKARSHLQDPYTDEQAILKSNVHMTR